MSLVALPFLLPFPFFFPTLHSGWGTIGGMMKRHGGNVLVLLPLHWIWRRIKASRMKSFND